MPSTLRSPMSLSPALHRVRFRVTRLEAWAPNVTTAAEWAEWIRGDRRVGESGEPALTQMPPMLRRHAGRLGRLACDVAYRTVGDLTDIPVVLSSRYGEVNRSVDLLVTLAQTGAVSPTSFGLSVHNAIGGLFSMARRDRGNSIALAAGDESAECGILEACSLLDDGAAQVLLVVADIPLPSIYDAFVDVEPAAVAWACLIESADNDRHGEPDADGDADPGGDRDGQTDIITLSWEAAQDPADQAMSAPAAATTSPSGAYPPSGTVTALRFLLGEARAAERTVAGRRWRWQRDA